MSINPSTVVAVLLTDPSRAVSPPSDERPPVVHPLILPTMIPDPSYSPHASMMILTSKFLNSTI